MIMDDISIQRLKAIADGNRLEIMKLLLTHNCCVGKLARELEITEAAVSQHLKVLREAGLIEGEKRGNFMHYEVKKDALRELARRIESLADMPYSACSPEEEQCKKTACRFGEKSGSHEKGGCSDDVRFFCHGTKPGHGNNSDKS